LQHTKKKSPDVETVQTTAQTTPVSQQSTTATQAATQKYQTTNKSFKDLQREVAQTVTTAAEPAVAYKQPAPETPSASQPQRAINQADIDTVWVECKQQFATDMQLRVIANDITLTLLSTNELQCVLQAQSQQTPFEQKIQPAIIRFFREKLGVTFSLHISVPEVQVEKKIYGAHESFDYLAQKNPAVESLRDKLGLEL
jgi:hypothetical protein